MNRQAEYHASPGAKSGALTVMSRKPCSACPIPSALIFSSSERAYRKASAIAGVTAGGELSDGFAALPG